MKTRTLSLSKEEVAALIQLRRQRVGWLQKKKTPEALTLSTKIKGCRRWRPCGSGACPVCGKRAQLGLARAIRGLAWSSKGKELFTLTVAPRASAVPVGKLGEADHANHKRRLKRALSKLPLDWLVGGTDFSLNEHEAGRYDPHWLPHLYAIGAANNLKLLRAAVKGRFTASDSIPRPVKIQRWDGRPNALLYAFKVDFDRRIGVDDVERFDPRNGKLRSCKGTNKQKLRSSERLELLIHLDRISILKRMFSLSSQIHHTKYGNGRFGLSIRLTSNGKPIATK